MKKLLLPMFVLSALTLTACNQDGKPSKYKEDLTTAISALSEPTLSPIQIENIEKLVNANNHKLLAIYDIGITGFKLILGQDNDSELISKTLISDDAKYTTQDFFVFSDQSFILDKIYNIKFDEEIKLRHAKADQYKNGFPTDKSFTITRWNGERKLVVFTDPDCPFCKRLEHTLKDIDNIEITYILTPIESLHPDAKEKSNLIWKAGDDKARYDALITYQQTSKLPALSSLDKSIGDYDFDYGLEVVQNLQSPLITPLMLNRNTMEVVAGALPEPQLIQFLDADQETADKIITKHEYKRLYQAPDISKLLESNNSSKNEAVTAISDEISKDKNEITEEKKSKL